MQKRIKALKQKMKEVELEGNDDDYTENGGSQMLAASFKNAKVEASLLKYNSSQATKNIYSSVLSTEKKGMVNRPSSQNNISSHNLTTAMSRDNFGHTSNILLPQSTNNRSGLALLLKDPTVSELNSYAMMSPTEMRINFHKKPTVSTT